MSASTPPDVHNALRNPAELLPLLPAYWAEQVRAHGLSAPGNPWASQVGIFRTDTKTPADLVAALLAHLRSPACQPT